jgi:trk system potassium uptake protein TrkH
MTLRSRILKVHPASLVLLTFLLVIVLGTLLLCTAPATRERSIDFIDALFTATSAVCVTGLTVVDTGSTFTFFGQAVILGLIQVGGLGVMTISVGLFSWLGRSISIRQRMAVQDLFAHTPREDIFRLVRSVVFFTLATEMVGAVFLTIHFSREMPFLRAFYMASFHSVSAFCNAGFGLFSDSLMRYRGDILPNLTICALIVIGGIGFPVLYDLQCWLSKRCQQRMRLSIQTRSVLVTTLILIVGGALMFAVLEHRSLSAEPTLIGRILIPLFQSITCRTAGFNTVDIGTLREATLAIMIFLMFFGASPGSCGGGVKTTTLALIAAFTFNRMKRKRRVSLFKKSIPAETVTRSISLILVSIGIICVVLFMLLLGDTATVTGSVPATPRGAFLAYLFETVSAFGTVGLSMGITAALSVWDKCWLILMMIVGRVGVLTFSYIVVGAGVVNGFEYAEENLMIG